MEERIQYYVEGEDEKKLLQTLKTDMQLIRPGKVQVFNIASKIITRTRLMALSQGTIVVAIFDTDQVDEVILKKNIKAISGMPNVKRVITVLQVMNLEDELVRCCKVRSAEELINARNKGEFKSRFQKISNLSVVLKKNGFDIDKLWAIDYTEIKGLKNEAEWIKKSE